MTNMVSSYSTVLNHLHIYMYQIFNLQYFNRYAIITLVYMLLHLHLYMYQIFNLQYFNRYGIITLVYIYYIYIYICIKYLIYNITIDIQLLRWFTCYYI